MADDKKKDDKKKDAAPAAGGDSMGTFFGIIIACVVLAYLLSGKSLSSGEEVTWGDIISGRTAPEGSPLNPDSGRVGEPIAEGTRVVNRNDATVRLDLLGAAVAGEQPERAKGTVKRGPEEAFGRVWYFVDYEEAPDGWVESSDITENVGGYTALHIVPILFDFLRPLFVGLAVAVGLALAWLWWQGAKSADIAERRAAEAYRAYLERTGRAVRSATPLAGAGAAAPANLPIGDLELPEGWGTPVVKAPREHERWGKVKALVGSATTSDWRQAIIEADIMLEEMLRAIGYDGVTIGDMLKNVDPADFVTLDKAWEAHKVRNQIAHRGMDFRVERNEAERTIRLYEDVFREFNYL